MLSRLKSIPSHHPVIVVPTYNTGPKVLEVVQEIACTGHPLIIVADGSTDGTTGRLRAWAENHVSVEILEHPCNRGKGNAVLTAARHARDRGFTHLLAIDADGQHPAGEIETFLTASRQAPAALVAGYPVFGATAPWERRFFRQWANFWTRFLGHQPDLVDSMFGMRVYPVDPLLGVMESSRLGRHYDFECVAAIKLGWQRVPIANLPVAVAYFNAGEGGVSHYHYLRDNVRLGLVYLALMPGALAHADVFQPRRESAPI